MIEFALTAKRGIDKLGILVAVMIAVGSMGLPFLIYRANRIVSGSPRSIIESLPAGKAAILLVLLGIVAFCAVVVRSSKLRLYGAVSVLLVLALAVGQGAGFITPVDNTFARVSPGSGVWLILFGLVLLATDALARMRPEPWVRIGALALALAVISLLLWSGIWDQLSVLREYANRADVFWRESQAHIVLALSALGSATLAGIPLGILCYRAPRLRAATLQVLNIIQTIPSIALFGILMPVLGFIAAQVPFAAALGIRGIGAAPAIAALFLYALLPIVANTAIGLSQVPRSTVDAARGMGLTARQLLFDVELPLAFPTILTGVRIVLVQAIGLAAIAGLIGGGGFGTFIFQGIGQTAMDLVLLGALPTVGLAFSAAIILDALTDFMRGTHS
ncbi:ABC transporter permease [Microvirga sp. M2]|uniref:ABC transporter permease n=1 Tax=Microvirga sp. M2 TaxID=3073270 RepID=UPI0039C061FF